MSAPDKPRPGRSKKTLSFDIGGTGIKAVLLDPSGKTLTEPSRVPTPKPATPKAVLRVMSGLAKRHPGYHRVSVGFPGVVRGGVIHTAPNLDPTWKGVDLTQLLSASLSVPVRVANDADVQGFGAIEGKGVELVITLGTGLGSALFVDGRLVPNLEAAHHPFHKKKTYEECLGIASLEKTGRHRWNKHVLRAIHELEKLFNYDRLYVGGGNARRLAGELPMNVKVVDNVAGLLGGIALWRETSS